MKKLLQTGLVITMIFLSATAVSQTQTTALTGSEEGQPTPKTYLNLMINVVSTNLNYGGANSSLADYKKSNNGIQAGVSFQGGITPGFSLVSELYFIRKGGKLKSSNPLTTGESTLHLNSIEIPVMARFHFGRFYVNAGPSIACNLSGNQKIGDITDKLSFTNTVNGYKRFDAGAQVGGGVEFAFKKRRLALDIRYNHGLTNISCDKEMYNRAVMISISFSKPWKKNPLAKHTNL